MLSRHKGQILLPLRELCGRGVEKRSDMGLVGIYI